MNQLRNFFRVGPARNDHHAALRCAVNVGVPLLTLLALGHTELAIFASFGAFTAIYGRGTAHRQRLAHQGKAGALMLVTILAGDLTGLLGAGAWGIVVGTTIVAGAGTLATGFGRLKPGGSLFQIFGFAAVASLPVHPPLGPSMLAAALTVIFSLLVGQSTWLWPHWRTPWLRVREPRLTAQERRFVYDDAVRYALAVFAAGSIATLMGIGHNYWAMVAAAVPLVGQTLAHRVTRGVHRILGTFGGLGVLALLLMPPSNNLYLVLVVAGLQFMAEMFIARHYSLAQLFVTPLALLMTQLGHRSDPDVLISDRATETIIGALVGMAVVVALSRWPNAQGQGSPRRAGIHSETRVHGGHGQLH
ncbi:FUSC family protein [Paenarthrobacter sp. Z7-10]|uniref:FUSC family protein n=1 Tax=Paenarthrobacter sp. Z7-10 TaxID=2787635 RepID=UPI0022A950E4|nr:FUSC family protein [Paenarthrobacter sp. Z7-10]MCZ2404767.1 FUSC family protein [Paenarthrobacter sp. Z7-10]